MKNEKIFKTTAVAILIFFIVASAGQAVIGIEGVMSEFEWEDDFHSTEFIDYDRSSNIEVIGEEVVMTHSNKGWHHPWPKMKKIIIQNSGSFQDSYVLPLEVSHDDDMEADYSDLRFVNVDDGSVYDLEYWVGEYNAYNADVWVRITPGVPNGESDICMFYGDPSATDLSNFDLVFRWDDRTSPDIPISHKAEKEGAWDPDVAYGGGRFLVAWEERVGPEDIWFPAPYWEKTKGCCIHGRTYNSDGADPHPPPESDTDIDISPAQPPDWSYHAENPAIAYGNNKFFVAWEENPADPLHPQTRFYIDIKGAIVTSGGSATQLSQPICNADGLQADPNVAYGGGKFLVVWEDGRLGTNNYNVWGRFYTSSGTPSGNEFQITSGANYEGEPWVCAGNGFFVVVYENGDSPTNGPFSLYAKKISSTGSTLWTKKIADGSSTLDNIYPAVCYNPNTDIYFVTWNDGDVSSGQKQGNVWGNMLTQSGSLVYSNFKIQSGYNYVRTDCVPYLDYMYFVTYDKGDELWGKLVYTDMIMTSEQALSDGSSQQLDWNNLAVSDAGRIFPVWEDERDVMSSYADTFGSVWHIYESTASPQISFSFGSEEDMVTDAVLVSKPISSGGVQKWLEFYSDFDMDGASIVFSVLDSGGSVLYEGLGDISGLSVEDIRLKAVFSRDKASKNPSIDLWGVRYIGIDIDPPWTEIYKTPDSPNGDNGWYTRAVDIELRAYDDGSGVKSIHYRIDSGAEQVSYSNPCFFTISESGSHTITYWAKDNADNVEDPNTESGIKIDGRNPKVKIIQPDRRQYEPGTIPIEAEITEDGSGLKFVGIYLNNDPTPFRSWTSFSDPNSFVAMSTFTAGPGEQHSIEVKAYDTAGNMGNAWAEIETDSDDDTTFAYSPEIGYLYTANGASEHIILHIFGLSLVITDKLNVWVKPSSELGTVDYVVFAINGKKASDEGTAYNDGEGYFRYSFDPPSGIYNCQAIYHDTNHNPIETFTWKGGRIFFINAF